MSTQITTTTELQAINRILSTIGEAPVNNIEGNTSVDVSVAKNILDETSVSLQSQGWAFNTQYDYTLNISTDKKVPLPSNTAYLDAADSYKYEYKYTIRDGHLYDIKNNTNLFDSVVPVTIVLIQQFEDIPQYARDYIVAKSARRFASRYLGSTELVKLLESDEQEAFLNFKQLDTASDDLNMLTGDANIFNTAFRTKRRTY